MLQQARRGGEYQATDETRGYAMTRKGIGCRDFPDAIGCTLYLSGEEELDGRYARGGIDGGPVARRAGSHAE